MRCYSRVLLAGPPDSHSDTIHRRKTTIAHWAKRSYLTTPRRAHGDVRLRAERQFVLTSGAGVGRPDGSWMAGLNIGRSEGALDVCTERELQVCAAGWCAWAFL